MGENDSINIEKELPAEFRRAGENGEKKGREEKKTPCFNPARLPLALSLYGSVACVSLCVCVCAIRAQYQCCSQTERLDQQTPPD